MCGLDRAAVVIFPSLYKGTKLHEEKSCCFIDSRGPAFHGETASKEQPVSPEPWAGAGGRGVSVRCLLYLIKELRVEKTPLQFVPTDP